MALAWSFYAVNPELPVSSNVRGILALLGEPEAHSLRSPVEEHEPLNSPRRLTWEADLLRRARSGERGALATLYRTYAPPVFSRVLLPKLGNKEAAEDALSETFRLAFERLAQFEQRDTSIFFWLSRIATNKAMDMHRAKRVTGRAIVNLEAQVGVLFEAPATPDALLSGELQRREFAGRLEQALGELNPRYRMALELRFFQELSREDCAARMEVKVATFDVLLLRATKALRKQWEDMAPNSDSTPAPGGQR
jgi:RNA polymerase sigma factor (sigma-70 family)